MNPSKRLVLASQSPRRVKLLEQIGLSVEVVPSNTEELFDPTLSAAENARLLALQKAESVARLNQDAIVVGADTIVVLDGQLLSKPANSEDAIRMLGLLSGRTHEVITGFALVNKTENTVVVDQERTLVTFRPIPHEEIETYVAGGSPMDKAGAYGIQDDYGALFVTRIEGCFYNVVGFPLARFYMRLKEMLAFSDKQMGRS